MSETPEPYRVQRGDAATAFEQLEVFDNPSPHTHYSIYWQFPEFTSLCPRTGYPDFATVHVWWAPLASIIELKSVKLWLNSFRDTGHYHEELANIILGTLVRAAAPDWMRVTMDYSPRGNFYTGVTVVNRPEKYRPEYEMPRLPGTPSWRAGPD